MKRRTFFSNALAASAVTLPPDLRTSPQHHSASQSAGIHHSGLMETIISLPDLREKLTILQVSDSHISCDNENDAAYTQYSERMNKAFVQVKHFKTGELTTPTDNFREIIQMGIDEKVDLV